MSTRENTADQASVGRGIPTNWSCERSRKPSRRF
jgi:hypothetical protein